MNKIITNVYLSSAHSVLSYCWSEVSDTTTCHRILNTDVCHGLCFWCLCSDGLCGCIGSSTRCKLKFLYVLTLLKSSICSWSWRNNFCLKMDTYIRAAFDELLDTDGLAVMAKGMGIQRLLIKFLQYYSMAQLSTGKKQSIHSSSINNMNNSSHLLSWKLDWQVNCGNNAWFCYFHSPSFHVYVIYWCSVSWRLLSIHHLMPSQSFTSACWE